DFALRHNGLPEHSRRSRSLSNQGGVSADSIRPVLRKVPLAGRYLRRYWSRPRARTRLDRSGLAFSNFGDYPVVHQVELASMSSDSASSDELPDTRTTKQLRKSPSRNTRE